MLPGARPVRRPGPAGPADSKAHQLESLGWAPMDGDIQWGYEKGIKKWGYDGDMMGI
jgi:hypothetical protein